MLSIGFLLLALGAIADKDGQAAARSARAAVELALLVASGVAMLAWRWLA
jgi:hypothetical protein